MDEFDISLLLHHSDGGTSSLCAASPELLMNEIFEELRFRNPYTHIEVQCFRKDSREDDFNPTVSFPFWSEDQGLRMTLWPDWFFDFFLDFVEERRIRRLPGPRPFKLPRRSVQTLLIAEDGCFEERPRNHQEARRYLANVPFLPIHQAMYPWEKACAGGNEQT